MNIIFLHPDLGIGGAERLIVDAGVALKKRGHNVHFFTAHHDTDHCFPETKNGDLEVTCVGDWLPRSTCGKFSALWAYLRMMYVALYVIFFSNAIYDVIIVDQISACIPLLHLKKTKVLFYCHYPDQLLATRSGLLRRMYRFFINTLEEFTTRRADCILVNSNFTASVFADTFKSIKQKPLVLYPSLNFDKFDTSTSADFSNLKIPEGIKCTFLSINRYERKKNLSLALKSLARLLKMIDSNQTKCVHLIMAGGYDHRVRENIDHYDELVREAEELGISSFITFLRSPSDEEKMFLLRSCDCLIYTPDKEHFGIVPIEAMYSKIPVIAVNSGGPKETVVHGTTGYLCRPVDKDFAKAMFNIICDKSERTKMGEAGHKNVCDRFSFNRFSEQLDYIVCGLVDERKTM